MSKDRGGEDAVARAEADLALYRERGLLFVGGADHTRDWNQFFSRGNARLFSGPGQLDRDALTHFWRRQIFISDNPRYERPRLLGWLNGQRRGERRMLLEMRRLLRREGCRELMLKYPAPKAGKPRTFYSGAYELTHRWARHLYHLKRVNEFLGPRLAPDFVALDIGCGHGLFSHLLHREYPGSHQILVDLPEQLLLARYFLEKSLPEAKIGGIGDLPAEGPIRREDVEAFDFVLLPWQLYARLESGSVDLMTSFAALGELTRPVFEGYVNAPVFRAAKFLYTANPVQTEKMFRGSDLTVLDYPLMPGEGCLHFGISPVFVYRYDSPSGRGYFCYRLHRLVPFFEYIGAIDPVLRGPGTWGAARPEGRAAHAGAGGRT